MTTKIIFASNKLGDITNEQLQQMLDQFDFGKLISAERTANGAMGQTMFVHSSKGEYVLKGNPLFPGQFEEEQYFVHNITNRSNVSVPTPYNIEQSKALFGWSYAIMPRLKGKHLNDQVIVENLTKEDRLQIAGVMADTLLQLHSWRVKESGEFDAKTQSLRPFEGNYTNWLYNRIRFWVEDAKKYSEITPNDIAWIDNVLLQANDSFDKFDIPTFVMGDFKPGNFLLSNRESGWEISGVFDFTNAYFGDPLADLIKILTIYIDQNELDVANHFLSIYLGDCYEKGHIIQRLKVHMLQQRILDWGCAKAIGAVTWDDQKSFSAWVELYTKTIEDLID
ncbi:aminoglycoside phosphotransferase family protein [Viridibacillus sp. YIM B01967]|uniref:Aminoglycoside phosphotransferase family protein n=1 Tax=Viridibacillus soli TaxID=2798301 RepID=A0ABS1HBK7_9BACL|nr:aminoglycoside phosphotransferase family protein [Viridibacillus soli]MBK3496368.1 aminoglycoside phosphotransferase family protein [Viridibacillus soli]